MFNFSDFHSLIAEYENCLYTYNDADKIVLLCMYSLVFVVALTGNVLVLVTVCLRRSVRNTVANRFLVNLTVADLLGKWNGDM